jgi:hypothetical protein
MINDSCYLKSIFPNRGLFSKESMKKAQTKIQSFKIGFINLTPSKYKYPILDPDSQFFYKNK